MKIKKRIKTIKTIKRMKMNNRIVKMYRIYNMILIKGMMKLGVKILWMIRRIQLEVNRVKQMNNKNKIIILNKVVDHNNKMIKI